MPIIKSAIKRAKQTLVRRSRNQTTKKDVKSALKAFQAKPTASTLSELQGSIDTAVKKNVLNPRTASRRKAQYAKVAKSAGVKLGTGTKKRPATAKKAVAKTIAKKTAVKPVEKTVKKAVTKKAVAKKPVAKKATTKK